ncbi:hypothetical protein IHE44_0004951 [Lamprotornis superbus]|uniref:Uromodulin-like 1 n=1 Tax=Lamprotornis superbus TaxID=245042 RepID=A0A835NQZ7_9PASS|nr:hypothetical protein IHE44_0004951 [Lamprotornis superbus]
MKKGLSLLGYHLCNYTLTRSVFKMVAYQKSYEKNTSCGGWIPWMVCPQTHYRTEFHTVEVPETITLTDCCEGYEQVGLYCSLALNRSSVFASRPGICPVKDMETFDYPCTFDTECPGLKKCCSSSKGAGCVDPMPEGRMFWYNVTVLVKMDFNELIRVDSHLLNHSCLLHSMVLLGMHHPAALAEVSSSLEAMVKHVYEVIDTQVQDVNECSYAEFNACPEKSSCVNLEGYYSCHPQHEHATAIPHWLSPRKEDPSAITNHRILSVTSSSFEMSWLVSSTLNHTFQVQVSKGNETVQHLKTKEMQMDVSHLEAGVMYSVEISYETCGKTIISSQNVKTEAKIFDVTMRILNYSFTDDFHNSSSSAYEEFSRLLLTELANSFPPNISALYKSGKLKVQIESLAAGSIIVRLRITVQDPEFPVDASTFAPVLSHLHNGSVLVVDQQNTAVEDQCASQAENDCSVFAECINLMGSYMCKTTMDTNPSRPVRNCEGEKKASIRKACRPCCHCHHPRHGRCRPQAKPVTLLPAALALGDKHSPTMCRYSVWLFQFCLAGLYSVSHAFHISLIPSHASLCSFISPSPVISCSWWSPLTQPRFCCSLIPFSLENAFFSHVRLIPLLLQPLLSPQLCSPHAFLPSPVKLYLITISFSSVSVLVQEFDSLRAGTWCLITCGGAVGGVQRGKKVSTPETFQNLSGTVQITNMEYSPGFSNTSSEEYQNFAQLFVDEVQLNHRQWGRVFIFFSLSEKTIFKQYSVPFTYLFPVPRLNCRHNDRPEDNFSCKNPPYSRVHKSLPLEVLQQMDAGLIKVLVAGVTNGSTVVSFNLLLAEEVDVHHVITTFCEALEHSSYFTIDRSSLSIHTLPFIQKATVMDKKPVHSTVLPVTSLQTSAHVSSPALLDFSPAEHKALEDTKFSSTVLPPLTRNPMVSPDVSPQASPAPPVKPAQGVSIKDAVSVFCEIERIILAIQKRFLQQESIPESSLFLGEPGCNVSTSNDTHVVLRAGWSDCGTQVETSMITTMVKTTLWNDVSAQGIIHHLNVDSPIHCVFQNDVLTSSGLYTIFEDLHGSGHFRTEMQLFIGNSPVPKNFSVSASEDVLIEVGMQRADNKLKVVLTDCWATPTNNSVDPLSFVFISNSCPIPNTYTTLLENGNSSKAQFKMKIFSFVNNSVVYLHCRIRICMESPGSTCRTRCHARARLLKAGETITLHRTSWGPLCKSPASSLKREREAGMGIGYIILIALAVFGIVLGVVTLLICQYQRRTGRYNLRIKSDNFTYQVFYD